MFAYSLSMVYCVLEKYKNKNYFNSFTNKYKMRYISILSFLVLLFLNIQAEPLKISSPDSNIRIEFTLGSFNLAESQRFIEDAPYYRVFFQEKPFILSSRLGFELSGAPTIDRFFKVTNVETNEKRSSWKPVYGERSDYPDNYNEMTVTLQEYILPNRVVKIVFRAYNEGIAFRYELPEQQAIQFITINRELTEFAFYQNTFV